MWATTENSVSVENMSPTTPYEAYYQIPSKSESGCSASHEWITSISIDPNRRSQSRGTCWNRCEEPEVDDALSDVSVYQLDGISGDQLLDTFSSTSIRTDSNVREHDWSNHLKIYVKTALRTLSRRQDAVGLYTPELLLRLPSVLGGIALIITSLLGTLRVPHLLQSPAAYVLELYKGFFGFLIVIADSHGTNRSILATQLDTCIRTWFQFLLHPIYKSLFYIFVGILCVVLGAASWYHTVLGSYLAALGIARMVLHTRHLCVGSGNATVDATVNVFSTRHSDDAFLSLHSDREIQQECPPQYVSGQEQPEYYDQLSSNDN